MNIRFGSVSRIFANPLDAGDGFLELPNVPSVEEFADAMAGHPEWPTSPATDVTIDGYSGTRFRITLPTDLDMPADGRYLLFQDGSAGDRWAFAPGQIIDVYVIDVDGRAIVLELFSYPDTPADDHAARQAVIDSIRFNP
jgi:hypothetical protein